MAVIMNGWIKLYRKIMENPIVTKDADHLAIWVYLLLNATHESYPALFKGERIILEPGQLITGRKAIATRLSISESKVSRVLDAFKNEHQIEQQTSNKNRLISIVNWDFYQGNEQQNGQQLNNNWTTSGQQLNNNWTTTEHKQECKNNKNDKNDKNVKECKNERNNTRETTQQIFDRLVGDYTISKPLIDKIREWITYKTERRESYKQQGLKTLLKRVENEEQKHGADAIINLIDDSMGNGWKGIIWERLNSKPNGSSSAKESYIDMWRNV